MAFESRVLSVVAEVTDAYAYFFNGTMFLESDDNALAVRVLKALESDLACGIMFSKAGRSEIAYDFI
jgi:hypothetical protein